MTPSYEGLRRLCMACGCMMMSYSIFYPLEAIISGINEPNLFKKGLRKGILWAQN